MSPTTFKTLKTSTQIASVILSVFINSLLITLIITKSAKKMGNYRHLMIYFCCCSIMFSLMDIFIRPVIHTYESAFFMVMDLRGRDMSLDLAGGMICAMAGCFGVIIYGIAIHFIYRYFALERNGRVKYFDTKFLPLWFMIPILGGVSWTLVSWFCFPMNPVTSGYIGPDLYESFKLDINQSAYAAALFYPPDVNGKKLFNLKAGLGLILYLLIMAIPFFVVIYVGIKSVSKIKQLPSSNYGKGLQMQLHNALVAQTIIPVVFLFVPFGVLFICPIFEINCQFLATILTFVYAIYPVLDPLPIFFFVQNYRNALSEWFSCFRCRKKSRVHIAPEEVSRDADSC
ncbi:Serpentine receptor class r-10 [Caenorhabditis elegans]|uniref:Serpentine receptor class r-10 n=1 Tax=Caenorhabditis elegans TaxID=6239 RepID=G5EGE5_CAEEL|nr:Seven TM Receptor [Caenorhabditis elegans]CAB03270.1 Seven TM Receptor [Caenorhabditis elegans]|eukprot:NP_506732.1 Seven TM Receptor [Caenorhabditis elegans]